MVRIPDHPKLKPVERKSLFSELKAHEKYWGPGGTVVRALQVSTVAIIFISALLTYYLWHSGVSNRDASMLLILICLLEAWLTIGLFMYSAIVGKRSEPVLLKLSRVADAGRLIIWAVRPVFRGLRDLIGRGGNG
jgi:hypothetical protein